MFPLLAVFLAAALPLRLAPNDPAADALVAGALKSAPESRAAAATIEAARRRVEPARTLPDPMLAVERRDMERGVMVSQSFPWPGKLALAGKTAASEAREVETMTAGRTALTLEARVRNAWYDLLLARALDRLTDQRRETARQIEAMTRERYAAGLAVQQDVLRAQVGLTRLDEAQAAQRAMIAARTAELSRVTGAAIPSGGELPPAAELPAIDEIVAGVVARSPESAAAAQAIETERLRVAVARKGFLPDFVVSAGTMSVSAGVSVPLWKNKRQQNELAEAEARVEARTADAETIARDLDVRTRERVAQLEAANTSAKLLRDRVIPLGEVAYESALASYQSGKVPFVTVFESIDALYDDRASLLARLAEAAKWRVAIDEAQ